MTKAQRKLFRRLGLKLKLKLAATDNTGLNVSNLSGTAYELAPCPLVTEIPAAGCSGPYRRLGPLVKRF